MLAAKAAGAKPAAASAKAGVQRETSLRRSKPAASAAGGLVIASKPSDIVRRAPSRSRASVGGSSKAAVLAVGERWRGLRIEAIYPLSASGTVLCISQGSVVDYTGDCIVNAANQGCLGGGGVDGAVTAAGGAELAAARKALPIAAGSKNVRCPTGEARLTVGGSLQARWCVHAVGPHYNQDLAKGDALLLKAYISSMDCARTQGVASIAFSLLSAGIFRGPQSLSKVLEQAVQGVKDGVYPGLKEVHLVAFKSEELRELQAICTREFPTSDISDPGNPAKPAVAGTPVEGHAEVPEENEHEGPEGADGS